MAKQRDEAQMHTVQILIEDAGNREIISGFLEDTYDILTTNEVQKADAYLIEDSEYPDYREALYRMVQTERPVFSPVVMIQGANSRSRVAGQIPDKGGDGSPVVDVIEVPVREPVLKRRLGSLLARREQSQKLQQKMEQVERQRDALSVLNQMIRHDIRNDLQLVQGYAQQLTDSIGDDGADVLKTVISSTEEAIELTEEAGDLSELLLAEDPDIGSIRIDEVVQGEIEAARNANPDVHIEYQQPEADLTVTGDQMLSSVVRNLVSNAIRHNDSSTPSVFVSLSATEESARLTVGDNGPGIPDEEKTEIFQHGMKRDGSPGTGIGLFLVSVIVDRYGGDVRVEDREPRGAKFIVELPSEQRSL